MKELFLEPNTLITSKTDLRGHIIYGNEDFALFSGYTEEEFLYRPHNIIRHPRMPKIAFKLLWETIKSGKEFFAYVKNKSKNDELYWVYANITPSFDENGRISEYYSVRRMANRKAVKEIDAVYENLYALEQEGGMEASAKAFNEFLAKEKISYDELLVTLQKL